MEIPHPSKDPGESIYGATKVFPDYQAEPGETYLGMVRIKDTIDRWIAANDIDAPEEARYEAVWRSAGDDSAPLDLGAAGVRSVVWATGFSSDWSWVRLPIFDGGGYPEHTRGVTTMDGVCVVGLPWLYTWGSGRFAGIAQDAAFVAEHLATRAAAVLS